jgi:pilus assembly protein Flp/PilA
MLNALRLYSRASLRADGGATAVEYGLMVGLIALVIAGAVALVGTQVQGLFQSFLDGMRWG